MDLATNTKKECDIILLSYESPDLLRQCVESVFAHTRVPSRLIIVDNASTDPEVIRFIESLEGNDTVSVEKIFSDENSGFASGMNKGMKISEAPYVCLLNNDCVVTDGWLGELIHVAETSPGIGMVNPQSNTFGSVPGDGVSIDSHALKLKDKGDSYIEIGYAIGFACLIKREVIDRVGYLDEAYRGVCYEDTDLSARAREAGLIPVIAESAYVFHHEQASRKTLPGKEDIYAANKKIFEKKWGRLLRVFIADPATPETLDILGYYEILKGFARQGVLMDVWAPGSGDLSRIPDRIREGVLIRHTDVSIKVLRKKITAWLVIWRVLTKKKKYDAVIVPEGSMSLARSLLSFCRRSAILTMDASFNVRSADGRKYSLREPALLAEALRNKII
jgi:GT2 family glycosyltransferase